MDVAHTYTAEHTPQFYLLHTLGCHLCDEAEAMLTPMFSHFNLTWKPLDIAEPFKAGIEFVDFTKHCDLNAGFASADASLAETLVNQFGLSIPVLYCVFSGDCLFWPFDEEGVLKFCDKVFNS